MDGSIRTDISGYPKPVPPRFTSKTISVSGYIQVVHKQNKGARDDL